MSDNTIWYTRCPVPTASGLAYQRRTFDELFDGSYQVRNIKHLGKEQANTHYHHGLASSFREGGGSPPIWAYANGAQTKLLGITFMEERLGIYVRSDDPAVGMQDLAGRRIALPVWPKLVFNFFRFAAEKGFYSALRAHGMSERDVQIVDVEENEDPANIVNPDFADGVKRPPRSYYHEQLQTLLRGDVDAIFAKGGEAAVLERQAGGKVRLLYDVQTSSEIGDRVNNSTPRLLTVSDNLLQTDPEAVTKYVQTLVRTAHWARGHKEEAVRLVAAESGFLPEDINCFEDDFTRKLMPQTTQKMIDMLEIMKTFLHERGYISRNFNTLDWLDPEPLAQACAREDVSQYELA